MRGGVSTFKTFSGPLRWAVRPLERPHGTSHHDIHVFLEYGLGREEGLESGAAGLTEVSSVQSPFAPGIRYGILT